MQCLFFNKKKEENLTFCFLFTSIFFFPLGFFITTLLLTCASSGKWALLSQNKNVNQQHLIYYFFFCSKVNSTLTYSNLLLWWTISVTSTFPQNHVRLTLSMFWFTEPGEHRELLKPETSIVHFKLSNYQWSSCPPFPQLFSFSSYFQLFLRL